jgi:hypothetical protein
VKPKSSPTPRNRRLITRRAFVGGTTAVAAGLSLLPRRILHAADAPAPPDHSPLKPIGQRQGHPSGARGLGARSGVLDWKGPGDGHWYDPEHIRQERVDQMMSRAVCD